jgi:hypothetical protein
MASRLLWGSEAKGKIRACHSTHPSISRLLYEAPAWTRCWFFISNLSAGGAALQIGQSIPSSSIHSIEFSLPGEDDNLTASLELVWRDVQGWAGIRFVSMSTTFSESLEKWLAAQPASQLSSKASA